MTLRLHQHYLELQEENKPKRKLFSNINMSLLSREPKPKQFCFRIIIIHNMEEKSISVLLLILLPKVASIKLPKF